MLISAPLHENKNVLSRLYLFFKSDLFTTWITCEQCHAAHRWSLRGDFQRNILCKIWDFTYQSERLMETGEVELTL